MLVVMTMACVTDPSPKTCQPSVSASWSNPCNSTKDGGDPASGSDRGDHLDNRRPVVSTSVVVP